MPTPLFSLTPDELHASLETHGQKKYRTTQVFEWAYKKHAASYEEMTNLPAPLRETLAAEHPIQNLTLAQKTGSADTTQKFLFRLHDGRYVETVLIPASVSFHGARADRRTACVSSQVGCAYGCKFCASGLAGFTRNLTAAEIVEQVIQIERISGDRVDNLVFMGMGEPLANLKNLTRAIEILNSDWGLQIGARHITVSTSGLAPQIKKLAELPQQIRLALSLHGATDPVRDQIMPINSKYPLDVLFDALQVWAAARKQKITFEYILIAGINDRPEDATALAARARLMGNRAKVNLIPYNKVDGLPWERPSEERQESFLAQLKSSGVIATLRREKGHDIDAACGQLRLKQETAEGTIEDAA